jgi:hypothetical protein
LVITPENEPTLTVDNIEVAQSIYLMLNSQKVRNVIDTITSKAVLILGRFTDERKAVLDALRAELRKRDYLPLLFEFNVPATRDITETVSLLARMARFIIADLTDPSSIPKELEATLKENGVKIVNDFNTTKTIINEKVGKFTIKDDGEGAVYVVPPHATEPTPLFTFYKSKAVCEADLDD